MSFFKRKKDEEFEKEIDDVVQESSPVFTKSEDIGITANLNLIKSKLSAQEEYRKALLERINKMTEEIGEIRGVLMNLQQVTEKTKVKAEATISLVESVKPEGLLAEIKKVDAKTETVKAKVIAVDDINTKIREELKDIRGNVKSFRSINEIIRTSNEIKDDIVVFKKIEANVNRETSKIESVFSLFQKKLPEFERLRKNVDIIDSSQKKFDKQMSQLNQKSITFAEKDDLINLKDHVNKNLIYLDKELGKFREFNKKMNDISISIDEKHRNIEAIQDKLKFAVDSPESRALMKDYLPIHEFNARLNKYVRKDTFSDLRYLLLKDFSDVTKRIYNEKSRVDSALKKLKEKNIQIKKLTKGFLRLKESHEKLINKNRNLEKKVKDLNNKKNSKSKDARKTSKNSKSKKLIK